MGSAEQRVARCSVFYWFGYWVFRLAFSLVWRMRAVGVRNVPVRGGVIIAANHQSYADPPLIGCMLHRPIHFMAKAELFDMPVLGWLIRQTNAFPVRRVERDLSAFRNAQRLIEEGEAVVVFPEGTRRRPGRPVHIKAGVGMLAIKTGAPVIPAAVVNSDRMGSFAALRMVYGEPLKPDGFPENEDGYRELAFEVMARVHDLMERHGHVHPPEHSIGRLHGRNAGAGQN